MRLLALACLAVFPWLASVSAQSSGNSSSSSSASPSSSASRSISLSLTTSSVSVTTVSRSGNQNVPITTLLPTVFNVTLTVTPTATSSAASNSTSASSTPTPTPIVLATKLDPAFGVLGALLIITGLPSAFWGHKNRWTSFFLIGFYTLSLICIVLILKFGVLPAVNPPSKSLRGYFVLASAIAGIAGGGMAIFFWKAAKYFIGAWGGFAFALWVQCFHSGGLIRSIGFRWILYIGCAVIGFVLCTVPKIHYHILLISTAFVGSTALMLGVDCYTTAGLKEFYVWNIGFRSLFPKYTSNGIEFPVSQTMQIELGLIGAISLMGIAVQLRVLTVLQRKLHEIAEEQKKQDEEAEVQAAEKFATVIRERDEWEREHPTAGKHARNESGYSSMPLMKDQDGSASPATGGYRSSAFTLVDGRPRHHSGVSDFFAAPTPDEELKRAVRNQSPGVLPALDLGLGIQDDVPRGFIAADDAPRNDTPRKDMSIQELEEFKRKEELMAEIQTIRRSIDALKSETPAPSSSEESRRPSINSRRTLSIDANGALLPAPSHLRPPREPDPRGRVHSMQVSTLADSPLLGESIGRPTSAPLRDDDWDSYVHDRKLLQPPAGVTAPIATTSINPTARNPMPPAVVEALNQRKHRESALGVGDSGVDSSEDVPLAKIMHKRSSSTGGHVPVTILPPRKPSAPIVAPTPQRPGASRTRTFEELNERHREKMRDLQAPLTQSEREHAELEAAKQRWERSKALEKEAVTRRQAEKAALLERKRRSDDEPRRSQTLNDPRHNQHSRSLSADKLAALGSSSKRLSTMKVEDWQKYQQDAGTGVNPDSLGAKRGSRALKLDGTAVPFPDTGRPRDPGHGSHDRRKPSRRDPLG